ncbi:unnamed protein product [Brugia pahangi]|uniref:Nuclear transport factor 2 family protein n=1 Tax=Brugia pahangi TaxID=6280 RepID=A0A0N4TH19_BRUPA|nr:unnamed protein product [Brugia pahangi]
MLLASSVHDDAVMLASFVRDDITMLASFVRDDIYGTSECNGQQIPRSMGRRRADVWAYVHDKGITHFQFSIYQ